MDILLVLLENNFSISITVVVIQSNSLTVRYITFKCLTTEMEKSFFLAIIISMKVNSLTLAFDAFTCNSVLLPGGRRVAAP